MLTATPSYILAIPTTRLLSNAKSTNLRETVLKLAKSGCEVYYYNENQVIVGSANQDVPDARLLSPMDGAKLYLITKLGADMDEAVKQCGEVLLDLGTSVLLKTQMDDVSLRNKISNPFTLLELSPIRLSSNTGVSGTIAETRTSIENLIAQVNADSVMYFIQSLQDMQTRYALADNRLTVANWIKSQFLRFGITNADTFSFQWNGITQYNVVATITGSVYPDTYIIVGGHHDSITRTTPYVLAPGADDNASGSTAAMEMARVMMASGFQPKCSIRFVTFAAEEFGLWGSKAYAQMADDANLDIRLMINHDMIANYVEGDQRVRLMPYDGFMDYTDVASGITSQYTNLLPVNGSMNSSSSDSHPFWAKGFPVIYYFEQNFSTVYHSDQDITANIDSQYCAEVIRASTAVAATYSAMPGAPSNLRVLDTGTGSSLTAIWDAPNDPNVIRYVVDYLNTDTMVSIVLSTTDTMIVLTGLTEGANYKISVCSIDVDGDASNYVSATGIPLSIPRTPANFVDAPFTSTIVLSWAANTEVDLAGYHLWRSMSPEVTGELLATITGDFSTYHDENLLGSQQYYYYRLSAFDNDANESPATEVLSSRPVSMNQGILLVDETKNFSGSSPLQPTDEMVDSFYDNLMDNFSVTTRLDLEGVTTPLRLADIGIYSSILWHGNDYAEVSYPAAMRDVFREYINRGGKILFSLYNPSQAFELNTAYPVTFTNTSFMRQVLGIDYANYSNTARFKYAIPNWTSIPYMQVDSLKTGASLNGHILKMESITPGLTALGAYTYGSDYASNTSQGSMNGQCVGVYNEYGTGKVFTLGFPLYFMEQASSQVFINHVFGTLFNEPSPNDDPYAPATSGFTVLPNHPNPFTNTTTISIESKDYHKPMTVSVYNLKGQLVNTLFNGIPGAKNSLSWDGKDNKGNAVSTGVYLLRVQQAGKTSTAKMLRLK
jgi:hypothetical protein